MNIVFPIIGIIGIVLVVLSHIIGKHSKKKSVFDFDDDFVNFDDTEFRKKFFKNAVIEDAEFEEID